MDPGTPREEHTPSKWVRTMRRGQVFRGEMAGSGGYGDPFQRDPEAVLRDVRSGWVSLASARADYGVAIVATDDDFVLDQAATAAVRAREAIRG